MLEPLGPQHNERDHAAWMSSIEHIRATSGYQGRSWPHSMTIEDNLKDLEMHARHFAAREGFTYTALDSRTLDVIGCVYVYPADDGVHDAEVRSGVRASRADLDVPLWHAVSAWLASDDWPFTNVLYASRAPAARTSASNQRRKCHFVTQATFCLSSSNGGGPLHVPKG